MKRRKLLVLTVVTTFLGASCLCYGAAEPTRPNPKQDPHNLVPFSLARLVGRQGKEVKGARWDGGPAIEPTSDAYPWFSVPLTGKHRGFYDKIRGKWLKCYMDTRGGCFVVALQDSKTRAFHWLSGPRAFDNERWTRLSHTLRFPGGEYESPHILVYAPGVRKGAVFANFRMYLLGTEPPEMTAPLDKAWNTGLKNLVEDPSFEKAPAGAALPPGWGLAKGGLRIVKDQAHSGTQSMVIVASSRAQSPILDAPHGVPLRVHFWAKGRGSLSVMSNDIDETGRVIIRGARALGQRISGGDIPLSGKWVKIELTSNSYDKNCRARRIDFVTLADTELYLDDVQLMRDMKVFPAREKERNPFTGGFQSANAGLEVTINGRPIAQCKQGITGLSVVMIKATPKAGAKEVLITGGLEFEKGGAVSPDPHWRFTSTTPPANAGTLQYDDSKWEMAPEAQEGRMSVPVPAGAGAVWFRRVVLWKITSYLVPDLVDLPIDKGKCDWITMTLNPPVPGKVRSYTLEVEVPEGCEVLPFKGQGAWFRSPTKVERDDAAVTHNGNRYRRYRMVYHPGHIAGIAGSYAAGRTSMVLIRQVGDMPGGRNFVFLRRVTNGNAVDLHRKVRLLNVPLDGTRPRDIVMHMGWHTPYFVGNPPAPTLDGATVDAIMSTWTLSGMTHSGWPDVVAGSQNQLRYDESGQWLKNLKDHGVKLMIVYQNFPFLDKKGTRTFEAAWQRRKRALSDEQVREIDEGKRERCNPSFGWLLSDDSREFWEALREVYKENFEGIEAASGLKVDTNVWDYEFGTDHYGGGYDRETLELFRRWAKIPADQPLNRDTVQKKFPGQYLNFSRWACRRVIEKMRKVVLQPLGVKFHVYYGKGLPFDAGGCEYISAWGLSQNIAGQIGSVESEYKRIAKGKKLDPDATFLGILQAEIQAVHRRRPFHWREFRNNLVKRVISTHGGGAIVYTEVTPRCPGSMYGAAAASRLVARYEDYFRAPDPVFWGDELAKIVTITPKPADVVLLRKGGKGLLLLFGGEPESQPKMQMLRVVFPKEKRRTVGLPPMGLGALEIDL